MSSNDPVLLPLRHVRNAIDRIEQSTSKVGFEEFAADPMRVAAVERYLLKVSEAAIRLGDQGPALCPGLPWHDLRGLGNWLRHQYDRVDLQTVWHTATQDLPPLKDAVAAALQGAARPSAELLSRYRVMNAQPFPDSPGFLDL